MKLTECLQPSKKTVKPAFMLVPKTTQTQWEIHTDLRGLNLSGTANIHQSSERNWPEKLTFKGCVTPRPIQSGLRFKRLCTRVAFVNSSKCNCSLKHKLFGASEVCHVLICARERSALWSNYHQLCFSLWKVVGFTELCL